MQAAVIPRPRGRCGRSGASASRRTTRPRLPVQHTAGAPGPRREGTSGRGCGSFAGIQAPRAGARRCEGPGVRRAGATDEVPRRIEVAAREPMTMTARLPGAASVAGRQSAYGPCSAGGIGTVGLEDGQSAEASASIPPRVTDSRPPSAKTSTATVHRLPSRTQAAPARRRETVPAAPLMPDVCPDHCDDVGIDAGYLAIRPPAEAKVPRRPVDPEARAPPISASVSAGAEAQLRARGQVPGRREARPEPRVFVVAAVT